MQIRKKKMLTQFSIPSCEYFIIDCDVGADDALCIIMAANLIKKHGKKLLGITCIAGNTILSNVVINALISTKIAGLKVPIFKGSTRNILGREIVEHADNYFHKDGLSGNQVKYINLLNQQDYKMVSQTKACDFIIQSATKYKNNFGIIAIGCMTNIAIAYMLDNRICSYVNCISCMGGTMSNLGRRQHFSSDFNFHLDPQATEIIFHNFSNIILTCLQFPQSYRFNGTQGIFSRLSNTLKRNYIYNLYQKISIPTLCDPLTLFPMFLAQEAEVEVYYAPCKVILSGKRTRGSLSIGWLDNEDNKGKWNSWNSNNISLNNNNSDDKRQNKNSQTKTHKKNIYMVCGINRDYVNKFVIQSLDVQ